MKSKKTHISRSNYRRKITRKQRQSGGTTSPDEQQKYIEFITELREKLQIKENESFGQSTEEQFNNAFKEINNEKQYDKFKKYIENFRQMYEQCEKDIQSSSTFINSGNNFSSITDTAKKIVSDTMELIFQKKFDEILDRDWRIIGFQHKEEFRDFRASYLLGIKCFKKFAVTNTDDKIITNYINLRSTEETRAYNFTLSVANFASFLFKIMKQGYLDFIYYTPTNDENMFIDIIYNLVKTFNDVWIKNKCMRIDRPDIYEIFTKEFTKNLQNKTLEYPINNQHISEICQKSLIKEYIKFITELREKLQIKENQSFGQSTEEHFNTEVNKLTRNFYPTIFKETAIKFYKMYKNFYVNPKETYDDLYIKLWTIYFRDYADEETLQLKFKNKKIEDLYDKNDILNLPIGSDWDFLGFQGDQRNKEQPNTDFRHTNIYGLETFVLFLDKFKETTKKIIIYMKSAGKNKFFRFSLLLLQLISTVIRKPEDYTTAGILHRGLLDYDYDIINSNSNTSIEIMTNDDYRHLSQIIICKIFELFFQFCEDIDINNDFNLAMQSFSLFMNSLEKKLQSKKKLEFTPIKYEPPEVEKKQTLLQTVINQSKYIQYLQSKIKYILEKIETTSLGKTECFSKKIPELATRINNSIYEIMLVALIAIGVKNRDAIINAYSPFFGGSYRKIKKTRKQNGNYNKKKKNCRQTGGWTDSEVFEQYNEVLRNIGENLYSFKIVEIIVDTNVKIIGLLFYLLKNTLFCIGDLSIFFGNIIIPQQLTDWYRKTPVESLNDQVVKID